MLRARQATPRDRATTSSGFSWPIRSRALSSSAGVPPNARQIIGCQGHKAFKRHAPSDVLDMRIEPAILVDDDDGRKLPSRPSGSHQMARDARRDLAISADRSRGSSSGTVCGPGIVVFQNWQQSGGRCRPACQRREPVEEVAAIHAAMGIIVEEIDDISGPSSLLLVSRLHSRTK